MIQDKRNDKIKIIRVYHDTKLFESHPCPSDGIRVVYNTQNNPLGPYLNEFVAILDQSIPLDTEVIGLEHYRRTFSSITPESVDSFLKKITPKRCCTYEVHMCADTIGYPYLDRIGLGNIKSRFQGILSGRALQIINTEPIIVWRSMFVMQTEDFIKLRDFLQRIKEFLWESYQIKTAEDILKLGNEFKISQNGPGFADHRWIAYTLEYLVDVWIRSNMTSWYREGIILTLP